MFFPGARTPESHSSVPALAASPLNSHPLRDQTAQGKNRPGSHWGRIQPAPEHAAAGSEAHLSLRWFPFHGSICKMALRVSPFTSNPPLSGRLPSFLKGLKIIIYRSRTSQAAWDFEAGKKRQMNFRCLHILIEKAMVYIDEG